MKSLIIILLVTVCAAFSGGKLIRISSDQPVDGKLTPGNRNLDADRLPENTVAVVNGVAEIRCAVANYTVLHSVQWWEYVTNGGGVPISENTNIGAHPNRDRYFILHRDESEYTLRISPVLFSDGGLYECNNAWSDHTATTRLALRLTVVAAAPVCNTTLPESGAVVEGQYHTNECRLQYQGGLIPNMTWSGIPPFDSLYVATPTEVWTGMQVTVSRDMTTRSHTCTTYFTNYFLPVADNFARNVPNHTHTHQERQMFVYWGPRNLIAIPLQDTYEVGDEITCYADSYPDAVYSWQNMRTAQITNGPVVRVDAEWLGFNQSLRCQAQNVINGAVFTANLFIPVDVPGPTTTQPTTLPSTTTLPPAVSPCQLLTGGWESTFPSRSAICLKVEMDTGGVISGLARNSSDTYWIDIVGRTYANNFDQVGFSGIWPLEMGVSSFVGECHRCFGLERILANVATRSRSSHCGVAGPATHTAQYEFYRSTSLQCPNV